MAQVSHCPCESRSDTFRVARVLAPAWAFALLVWAGGATAHGQVLSPTEAAAEARVKLLTTQAMERYDSLEFEEARKLLQEAVDTAQEAGPALSNALAQAHLSLGVVTGAGLNEADRATELFLAALRMDRTLTLDPARATPALEEMFERAKQQLGPIPADGALPILDFRHTPVDEVAAGKAIEITASITPAAAAGDVALNFRSGGAATYQRLPMQAGQGDEYRGVIPAEAIVGRAVQYYVVVLDAQGKRIAGSGTPSSPNIVAVTGGATGDTGTGETDLRGGMDSGGGGHITLAVYAGTGGGVVVGGESEGSHPRSGGSPVPVEVAPGLALAPFHLAGEVAYAVTPQWQVSALARVQLVNLLEGAGTKDHLSVLGVIRAKRFFGADGVRYFVCFGAGGGQIRHRVALGHYDPKLTNAAEITDARVAGLAAINFGGGAEIALSDHFALVADLVGLILVPDFAAHADLNLGVAVTF